MTACSRPVLRPQGRSVPHPQSPVPPTEFPAARRGIVKTSGRSISSLLAGSCDSIWIAFSGVSANVDIIQAIIAAEFPGMRKTHREAGDPTSGCFASESRGGHAIHAERTFPDAAAPGRRSVVVTLLHPNSHTETGRDRWRLRPGYFQALARQLTP